MTTTKSDIAQQMSEYMDIEPEEAVSAIESLLSIISETLVAGGHWELRNFGVFKLKQRAPRTGRNIHTGDSIPVPPYRDVIFKPGKTMLENVSRAPEITAPAPRKKR